MSPDIEYKLQPDRQELDLKGFSDPHMLSWIYGCMSWTVLMGYVSFKVTDRFVLDLVFYLLLGLTVVLILLQITGVVIAYIGKKAAFRRINKSDMSIRIEDGTFTFTREGNPVIVIPTDNLLRVEVLVDKHGLMLGPGTGYNVVTRSYDQRTDDTSVNITKTKEDGETVYQFWLDSRAIGTEQQINSFHQWLTDHGLDEHMERRPQESAYEWSASDGVWFAVHTMLLLGTIGYAYLAS